MAFFGGVCLGRTYTSAASARREVFRRIGEFAWRVVARSMAVTLRRKSTANAKGVYGLKKDCRDCNTDQRTTAAFFTS